MRNDISKHSSFIQAGAPPADGLTTNFVLLTADRDALRGSMGKTGVGRLLDMGPKGVLGTGDMDAHAHWYAPQDKERRPQGAKDYACATCSLCPAQFRCHADDMVWRELPSIG